MMKRFLNKHKQPVVNITDLVFHCLDVSDQLNPLAIPELLGRHNEQNWDLFLKILEKNSLPKSGEAAIALFGNEKDESKRLWTRVHVFRENVPHPIAILIARRLSTFDKIDSIGMFAQEDKNTWKPIWFQDELVRLG